MRVKAIYTATSGVEYVKDSNAYQKRKRSSNSGQIRILMYIKRESFGLSFKDLQSRIVRDTGVFVGYRQLIEFENVKYLFSERQREAIAQVLGLEVEDLDVIENY